MRSLLVMPPFWDPYCPPLGITSLQASLVRSGHDIAIHDYNTDGGLWRAYKSYFEVLQEVIPATRKWNVLRLGPDYFSRHLMAWLSLRDDPKKYGDISRHILNIDGRLELDPATFEPLTRIFEAMFARIDEVTDRLLDEHKPGVFGCTLLTTTLPSAVYILRRAKEKNPEIRTVLGGPGPIMGAGADSPDTHRILEKCPWIDNLVIGEGEVLIDAIIRNRLPRRKVLSLRDVPALESNDGLISLGSMRTERQGLIKDISTLPTPDYTGLTVNAYPNLSVGISRGCAYQCSFCYETTYWKRYRKRPMDSAVHDLRTLSERYGRNRFFLCDSLANFFADDLSNALQEQKLDIKWDAYLRADKELLDQSYVQHLADGGMVRARLGLESADTATLEIMNKKASVDHMGTVLENLAKAGIETSTLWIVGFPTEDERAFQSSLDFLREHKNVIHSADPWQFIFHPTTGDEAVFGRLVAADSFESKYGMRRLYPEEYDDALLVQYYELDIPDAVSTKMDRLERMCALLNEEGIPNPYSMREWRAAAQRWRTLHPQAAREPLKEAWQSVSDSA